MRKGLPEKESKEASPTDGTAPADDTGQVSAEEKLEHDTFVEETLAEALVEDVFPPPPRQARTSRRLGAIPRAFRVLGRSLVR
jgi:hypothetical protein